MNFDGWNLWLGQIRTAVRIYRYFTLTAIVNYQLYLRDLRDLCGDSLLPIDSPPNALGAMDAKKVAELFSALSPRTLRSLR